MEQLSNYFTPKNYQLDLFVDKKKKLLNGEVVLTGRPKADFLKLHAVDMTIEKIELNGEKVDFIYENGEIYLKEVPKAEIILKIAYRTPLNENMVGAYLSTYEYKGKEEVIVATQFESHYARECFPCIDEPAAKATFDLKITTTDKDDIIIANTPVKAVEKSVENFSTIFETTPKMSTYLLAFVIGKFHQKSIKSSHGVKITSFCALNQDEKTLDFANEVAARSLDYYDDLFGIKYPLEKLDQVALPDFEAGAMENWGLVTYRESRMLADENSSVDYKKDVALTITHELSHQWFGDLVTMQWWDDLWLNESFASVLEYFATDALYPEFNIWEDFFTGDCLAALRRDSLFGVQSVKQSVNDPAEIATLFDGAIVYAKGAHLMFMLIRLMGEKRFFSGIKEYFKKYQYKNTVGDDLWDVLSAHAAFDVKKFMNAWISQPGFPVITDGVNQRFCLTPVDDRSTWPIPKISDDMSGHYLINLSGPEFADALKNFKNLSLEQRLRLLIDRMLLSKTPLVSSSSLIDLLTEFKSEDRAAVWGILASIVASLKILFEPDSKEEGQFKAFLRDFISERLKDLGLTPKPNEDQNKSDIRKILLGIARYSEDLPTLERLSDLYNDDLKKINPEIRDSVLGAKFYLEEEEYFPIFLKKYQTTSDSELRSSLLFVLSCAKLPKNIEKLINLLSEPKIVRPQDHLFLYIYLIRNSKAKSRALSWLYENWDYILKITGEKSIEDYPRYIANSILTEAESDAFFAFFDPLSDLPVLSRTISVAKTEVKSRLELIKIDQKAVKNRLKSY